MKKHTKLKQIIYDAFTKCQSNVLDHIQLPRDTSSFRVEVLNQVLSLDVGLHIRISPVVSGNVGKFGVVMGVWVFLVYWQVCIRFSEA